VACSGCLSPDLSVGDLTLDEIWNHEWFRALRRRLHAGAFTGPCETCTFVHGSVEAQELPIREGVQHPQASRFFRGGYGHREPIESSMQTTRFWVA
jgi:hypothetical protein